MQFEEKPHSANAATVPSSEIASSSGKTTFGSSKTRKSRISQDDTMSFPSKWTAVSPLARYSKSQLSVRKKRGGTNKTSGREYVCRVGSYCASELLAVPGGPLVGKPNFLGTACQTTPLLVLSESLDLRSLTRLITLLSR